MLPTRSGACISRWRTRLEPARRPVSPAADCWWLLSAAGYVSGMSQGGGGYRQPQRKTGGGTLRGGAPRSCASDRGDDGSGHRASRKASTDLKHHLAPPPRSCLPPPPQSPWRAARRLRIRAGAWRRAARSIAKTKTKSCTFTCARQPFCRPAICHTIPAPASWQRAAAYPAAASCCLRR